MKKNIFLIIGLIVYWFNSLITQAHAAITNVAVPGGSSPDDSPKQFAVTIATLWQTIILVGGLAFILYFLLGGITWITAGGDKGKIEEARSKITNGIIGLAVVASAWAIYLLIDYFFGIGIVK